MIEELLNKSLWRLFFSGKKGKRRKHKIDEELSKFNHKTIVIDDDKNQNNNNDDNQEDQKKTVVIAQREYDDYIHDLRDSFNGLDLEYAVTAHLKWRYKLEQAVEDQNTKDYTLSLVGADNNCALGKWIHNQAKESYSDCEHSEIYIALQKSHAKFHRIAAEILNDVNNGEIDIAKMKIKREFARCSDAVQLDLLRLCIASI